MSEDLQERPALCDTPGISKGPGSMHAKHCGPDTPKPAEKAKPDIRSKALTDTKKKREQIRSLGLTHENKKTYKEFTRDVSEVFNVGKMSDKKLRDFISSFDMDSKMGNVAAMQLRAAKKEASKRRLKEDDESWTIEANLNDYVKKFQMKMGDKTSAVDKDAWVDGIGGLTKRERKTLKRTLQVHTREGLRKFEDLKQQDEIAPIVAAGLGLAGRAALGLARGAVRGAGRVGTAGAGFGLGQAANAIAKTPGVIGKAVAGGVAAGATKAAIDHHLKKKREAEAQKKEEVVNELSPALLHRAANTARDDAGHQRQVSKTAASRIGDPEHPPGQNLKSKRANYQAAKRDYQTFKFSTAARKKERETKEGVDESTKEYAKSLEKIANDKALKMLSKSERSNLLKIRDLLAKERREDVEPVDEILPAIAAIGSAIGGAAKAAVATPVRRAVTKTVAKKIHKKVTDRPQQDSTSEGIFGSTTPKKTRDKLFLARSRENSIKKEKPVNESKGLQAQMALDDARIKFKMEDGKIYVDKKDVMKAEKTLAKSFKTKPTSLDGKKFPAIYYHGGSLGIWNKKRPITGMGR